MFPIDAASIDKSLPVPVGTQLYGLLSYALAFSNIPYGTKLQSVRQLASELGIAPMTVSQVYQQLRDEGLIEMRAGLGAFAAGDPRQGGRLVTYRVVDPGTGAVLDDGEHSAPFTILDTGAHTSIVTRRRSERQDTSGRGAPVPEGVSSPVR